MEKKLDVWNLYEKFVLAFPMLERQRQVDLKGSLSKQPILIGDTQASEMVLQKNKPKEWLTLEVASLWPLPPYTQWQWGRDPPRRQSCEHRSEQKMLQPQAENPDAIRSCKSWESILPRNPDKGLALLVPWLRTLVLRENYFSTLGGRLSGTEAAHCVVSYHASPGREMLHASGSCISVLKT